ncbi:MAG: CoA-binding protein [archaeon]|nr:CoA-binding protein [archaeon]
MTEDFINKTYTYAIVGASNNPTKYGYKVLKSMRESGYTIIPLNPKEENIQGTKAYETLESCNGKIDVVIFIVPPQVTEKVLEELNHLKIKKAWMQPGSESKKAIDYCKNHNIDCIHDTCIMLQKKN